MRTPVNHRRPPFPNRPWVRGKAYDDYARAAVLHCDAYLLAVERREFLLIDWREGGMRQVALDAYLLEPDGLTPVWDALWVQRAGSPLYWTWENHARVARMHKRVLAQGGEMIRLGSGRWSRVVTQCHYVRVADVSAEPTRNLYVERVPKTPDPTPRSEDLFSGARVLSARRGRPPGSKNKVREEDDVRLVPKPGTLPDLL